MITTMNLYYKELLNTLSDDRIKNDVIEVRQFDNLSSIDFSLLKEYSDVSIMRKLNTLLSFAMNDRIYEKINQNAISIAEKVFFSSLEIDNKTDYDIIGSSVLRSRIERNCRIYVVNGDYFTDSDIENNSYRLFEFSTYSTIDNKNITILDIFITHNLYDSENNTIELIGDVAQYILNNGVKGMSKYIPNKRPFRRDNPVGDIVLGNDISIIDSLFIFEYAKAYIEIINRTFDLGDEFIDINPIKLNNYKSMEDFIIAVFKYYTAPSNYDKTDVIKTMHDLISKNCR